MALWEKQVSINSKKLYTVLAVFLGLSVGLALFQIPGSEHSTEEASRFNNRDIMFMNMMIIHHDQAIEMAQLAENRTDSEKILGLAENISEAQTRENRQMAEWLRQQGYQRPRNGHRMAGMASQEQMQRLENSEGKDFNRLFAELMIEHHRGGIEMARNFREAGRYSELKNMQTGMIQAQQTEIEKMKKWQKQGF